MCLLTPIDQTKHVRLSQKESTTRARLTLVAALMSFAQVSQHLNEKSKATLGSSNASSEATVGTETSRCSRRALVS